MSSPQPLPLAELNTRAIRVLIQEMGVVNTACFIHQLRSPIGNGRKCDKHSNPWNRSVEEVKCLSIEWPNGADFAPAFLLSLVQKTEHVAA
ncbi:hypothetical protein EYB53_010195 [Candidatus Chloroploca sp. M-50]|uniref:Uncharacterized protein n=1 Tax=Candidatus Chloroploca mongolica TaxID=2528176 RepID=A0ABS4D9F6_9CHLR|nr:hypothetical protein [Candidatus Chloroploca mongolica]MBP1466073.1 hypothetical protein [Candidatus Chloroploca mongolica]